MRLGAGILVFCLALGLGQAEAGTENRPNEWTDDYAAICYLGGEGYVVAPPPGWGNLPEAAAGFGLCGMYTPERTDFHGAPAIIYPRVVAVEEGESDPAGALARRSLGQLSALPDGKNTVLRESAPVVSASGLEFKLFFIDNGPQPNQFELLACHPGQRAMLILVLSTTSMEDRDRFVPGFMQMLDEVFTMQVKQAED